MLTDYIYLGAALIATIAAIVGIIVIPKPRIRTAAIIACIIVFVVVGTLYISSIRRRGVALEASTTSTAYQPSPKLTPISTTSPDPPFYKARLPGVNCDNSTKWSENSYASSSCTQDSLHLIQSDPTGIAEEIYKRSSYPPNFSVSVQIHNLYQILLITCAYRTVQTALRAKNSEVRVHMIFILNPNAATVGTSPVRVKKPLKSY